MRLLASSDWHIRDDKPRCRVDDWFETQRRKLEWVVEMINTYECPMYVAGDIMDSPSNTQALENMMISVLKKAKYPIYSIAGNHDMHYHSIAHLYKSTYWVLVQAGVLTHMEHFQYGEPLAPCDDKVVMAHLPVYKSLKDIPPYMTKAVSADSLFDYGYPVLVTGDIHIPFYKRKGNQIVINPGGLLRQDADKKYHNPIIYFYDGEIQEIKVPINTEDVQQEYLLSEKERDDRISSFVEVLSVTKDIGLSFRDNMINNIDSVSKEAKIIVMKALEGELHGN